MKTNILFGTMILVTGFFLIPRWKAETTKSQINFTIKGPFGTVHGKFTGLKSDIKFDPENPGKSSIKASIDASTVSTGIGLRNKDLREKELWLNTEKYPLITFQSEKIEQSKKGFIATGDLTLKGRSRSISIPFTFDGKGNTGVFKGKFSINREDFNIGKKGGSVGKTISIDLNIPVKK